MTFSTICIMALIGLVLGAVLTYFLIPLLKKMHTGQKIREEGPESHFKKAGTPSMGGIAIIAAAIIAMFVYHSIYNSNIAVIIAGFLLFALVGFCDDYLKVIKHQNEGLKVKPKFALQFIIALALSVYIAKFSGIGTQVFIPFAKEYVDFGIWFIPFLVFTFLAMVNAVNFTDGLDGLAAGTTAIVCFTMAIIAMATANSAAWNFLNISPADASQAFFDVTDAGQFYAALLGACLGFLVLNHYPAKVFMGDTGSLALGGGITVAAVVMKMELILPIVGLIYVLEVVSVIMQVCYFKATGGKRIFRMTPLHHHFQEGGMKETKVVIMFWLVTFVCCIIGYAAVV
ncbi:MAG: phospho-N-acetylmuramoyl-pentapeptide-transferase [Eubacteriaceae bacterium]|nr:phospho-N-acetylmuramoyl-pentapeptide-transferase [Eubacteriaceae bacterium]